MLILSDLDALNLLVHDAALRARAARDGQTRALETWWFNLWRDLLNEAQNLAR